MTTEREALGKGGWRRSFFFDRWGPTKFGPGGWRLSVGPFYACGGPGGFWFRLFGFGAGYSDHRLYKPLLSEREGRKRPRPLHVGPFCFFLLAR